MNTHIDTTLWLFALATSNSTSINIFTFFAFFFFIIKCLIFQPKSSIPGPRGFPIIASMHLMSGLAHRKIAAAAQSYRGANRLMAFSLGETRVIVTCSPDVAKDILNSSAFADRPVKESAYRLMFNRAIGFAPYGVYWRTLRRIAATHLFCPNQIKVSEGQRMVVSNQMVEMFRILHHQQQRSICVRDVLKRASLTNMMWSVFGRRYRLDSDDVGLVELRKLVDEGYELLGVLNWTDHLPWLADFDPQGIRSRCSKLVPKVNRFVKRIIDEHRAHPQPQLNADFTHVLLSLEGSDKISEPDMIAVLWEMIFRGTDTVAVLIEWILARMVVHVDVQSRIQDEVDQVVGRSRRPVTESDITNLVYLGAVVKEVLRLHPPGPLLSWARLAITDTTVDGHHVAAGTMAMVNMWAISRDPQIWKDPLQFKPDRFLDGSAGDMSVMGSDLRLAPFGSGRRSCPGKNLGLTTVSFWVASLLQEFEFGSCEEVDLSEELKLSCEMLNPLKVTLRPRLRPA